MEKYLHGKVVLVKYVTSIPCVRGGPSKLDTEVNKSSNIADFQEIVKKAYEKGVNEHEMTLEKLIEDIKADLKNLMVV